MMPYGSVVNRILESAKQPEIKPGMGGTVCHWSDRTSVTVVAVRYAKDGKTVKEIDVVGDQVSANKRVWPDQSYDITPGWTVGQEIPKTVQTWRVDNRGRLRPTYVNENGRRVMAAAGQSAGISLGERDHYSDPHF